VSPSDRPADPAPPARDVARAAPVVRARRRLGRLAGAAVVVAVTTTAWATVAWDADPTVRLARTVAPPRSTITAAVTSEQLAATLVVRATFGYDGAEDVSVAASPQTPELVATALPRRGAALAEGDVAMTVNGTPVLALEGALPMYRDLALGDAGPDVDQVRAAFGRLGALGAVAPAGSPLGATDLAAYRAVLARAGYTVPELRPDRAVSLLSARHAVLEADDAVARARAELDRATRAAGLDGDAARQFTTAAAELATRERDVRAGTDRDDQRGRLALADLDQRARRLRERLHAAEVGSDEHRDLTDEVAALERQRLAAGLDATERTEALRSDLESIERERLAALQLLSTSRRDAADDLTDRARHLLAATRAVEAARAAEELAVREATSPIPAFGVLVVSGLPRTVVATRLRLGRPIEGPVATLAGARPVVTAELDDRQREPIRPGLAAVFTADLDGREVTTVVEEVRAVGPTAATSAAAGGDAAEDAGGGGDEGSAVPVRQGSGGTGAGGADGARATNQLVAVPADGSLTPPPGGSVAGVARVRTPVTPSAELVVPAAALHLGPDGRDLLRVRSAGRRERQVVVSVLAEVDGRVAVRATSGALAVGDEVVLDAR